VTERPDPGRPSQAELKRVTVMFADITGFTTLSERSGVEEAYSVVTECLKLLDGVVRRHGGAVDKYLGDCLMAVFGHPVAVEQAARRAVQAAVEVRRLVRDYQSQLQLAAPLDVQIGINTGELIAGQVGEAVRREFAVMGDAVNVAARLKDLAPRGQIFVGPETEAEARDHFEFRALKPLRLKGKRQVVTVHELARDPEGGSGQMLALSRLVGRHEELQQLEQALLRLAAGGGGVVTLSGEEGMGKSRLLAELSGRLPRGVEWVAAGIEMALGHVADHSGATPVCLVLDGLEAESPEAIERLPELLHRIAERPVLLLLAFRSGGSGRGDRILELVRAHAAGRPGELSLRSLEPAQAEELLDEVSRDRELSPEARELVRQRAHGCPREIVLSVFLAPALLADARRSADDERRDRGAERRRATIVFADISGFTSLSEQMEARRAHEIFTECLELLDDIARAHGGTVDKYLGDCILAVFGFPVAIEDAPGAAINAAIEMRRKVDEFSRERTPDRPLRIHSGIDTGLAVAGDISGPLIHEYALMGDSVNVASRLKDLAKPGEIRVGPGTARDARARFQFEPLSTIQLRGQEKRVPTYLLLSEHEQLHRRQPGGGGVIFSSLVGRDAELSRLREIVKASIKGRGAIVSLVGEAGLGKSRLASELVSLGDGQAVSYLLGRSLSIGANLSFHPFVDLLRNWMDCDDADDEKQVLGKLRAAIARVLPESVPDVFPFLAHMMGLTAQEEYRERIERIQGEAMEKQLLRSMAQVLRALAAERPLVLILEDLHWADLSSIELLEDLLEHARSHPIVFVNVFRPGFAATSGRILEVAREKHAARHAEMPLRPLDPADSKQLIDNLFRSSDVPAATRSLIEEKARGNPFYVEEVVRSLLEEGALEFRNGAVHATAAIHLAEIPGTIQEVVMGRIDRLAPAHRTVLQIASVIGASFHYEVLAEVANKDSLEALLAELVAAEMLVTWDQMHGFEYAFKHPLIHEVAYDSLLVSRRESLHLDVAHASELHLTENVPGFHGMLAYHYGRGRDLERAEDYVFRAGDEAARLGASSEALHFFKQASALYLDMHGDRGDPRKRALLEKNIAFAHFNRGDLADAVEHINESLELRGLQVPKSLARKRARFASTLVRVLWSLYGPLRRRRRPPALSEEREIIELMFNRARAETTASPERFLYDSMETLSTVLSVDPRSVPRSGGTFAGVVGIFSFGGISFRIGRRFLQMAREVVHEDDLEELLTYRLMSCLHHLLEGDWSPAHEVDDALLQEGLRYGQIWDVVTYLGLDSEKKLLQGRFEEAWQRVETITQLDDLYQFDLATSNRHGLEAFYRMERREFPAALEAAETYYREHDEELLNLYALATKAKAQCLMGALQEAEATLDRAAALMRSAGVVPPYHSSAYYRSRLLVDLARIDSARCAGTRAPRSIRRRARRNARRGARLASWAALRRAEMFQLVGTLAWLEGDGRRAARWWQRSLGAAAAVGMRPALARSHLEVGRRLLEDGRLEQVAGLDAEAHLERAERGFRELELEWDLGQLEALRRSARAGRPSGTL
jgi:class 3 adenylate cyclase/tetratricopeptide (TPR) repeat protein